MNLNQKIIELLISEDYQSRLPQVGGEEIQVFISHVADTGDIFVQKETNTFTIIEKMIRENSEKVLKGGPSGLIGPNQLFLARFAEDNNLYRAELLSDEKKEGGKLEVFFVDFGNCALVDPLEIYDVRLVSESLGEMPRQALRCRLAGVPPEGCAWSPAATQALRELVPESQAVRLKVVGSSSSADQAVPLVELHLNNTTDGSINFDLSTEFDIFPPLPADKNSSDSINGAVASAATSSPSRTRIEPGGTAISAPTANGHAAAGSSAVSAAAASALPKEVEAVARSVSLLSADLGSMRPLPPPEIPGEGEHFDVNVTFAVSPSSFVVQPFNELDKLDTLMADMNTFYSQEANLKELTAEDLTEGEYFAGKGSWYRYCCTNIS